MTHKVQKKNGYETDHKEKNHYWLTCRVCGRVFDDDGYILECPGKHEASLLKTEYVRKQFECDEHANGIFRYHKWLPVRHPLPEKPPLHIGKTITYHSQQLGDALGLPHLWIAFNGYWPEKNIFFETTTFKELEAYTVAARTSSEHGSQEDTLVVSSAGNTAAAFASVYSQLKIHCLIIIPESGLQSMQFTSPLDPCIKVVSLSGADYVDAIVLANTIAQYDGFVAEGGAKNVARRGGLGTVLLSAVEAIGRLPDYYFQAVGSGTGAIAVHDVATKLIQDGRFGQVYPRLMLSQNLPFVPIYSSWKARRNTLIQLDRNESKRHYQSMAAPVLSNQNPPYALKGGVFDILTESRGEMFAVNNQEAFHAMDIFQKLEKIDINSASGVALTGLLKAIENGQVDKNATILLNITGGGQQRLSQDYQLIKAQPILRIDEARLFSSETLEKITKIAR
jgi:cysteate synthase